VIQPRDERRKEGQENKRVGKIKRNVLTFMQMRERLNKLIFLTCL